MACDVVQFCRDVSFANIVAIGIDGQVPINLSGTRIPLRRVLEEVAGSASGTEEPTLEVTGVGNVILLARPEILKEYVQYLQKSHDGESPQDSQARQRLKGTVPKMHLNGIELSDILGFLEKSSRQELKIYWDELSKAGIKRRTYVHIQGKGITLEEAIGLIFLESTGKAIDYNIVDGAVAIPAKEPTSAPAR